MYGYLIDALAQRMTVALMRRELFAMVANAAAYRLSGGAHGAQAAGTKVGKRTLQRTAPS